MLTGDADIRPTLEVLEGDTDHWLHVLHRVKAGRDVFFMTNQHHDGPTKHFHLRARAAGIPECWDAMRGQVRSLDHERVNRNTVDFSLTLEPLESVLVIFSPTERRLPDRWTSEDQPYAPTVEVKRKAVDIESPSLPSKEESPLKDCHWVWHAADPGSVPPCERYFRGSIKVPQDREIVTASMRVTADNDFTLYVNGEKVAGGAGGYEDWRRARTVDLTDHLKPGPNTLAVKATNFGDTPNPAGLIGAYQIVFQDDSKIAGCINKSWKSSASKAPGWTTREFGGESWSPVKEVAQYGGGPWNTFEDQSNRMTLPPVTTAGPFVGQVTVPDQWLRDGLRVCLETADIPHEDAAAVAINGQYAGGFIGKPFRLDVTKGNVFGRH